MGEPNIAEAEALLSKVFPPRAILALGAVLPQRFKQLRSLTDTPIMAVHADQTYGKRIGEAMTASSAEFSFSATAIARETGKTLFFKNSLERESGLISAEALKPIWKNLETTGQQECETVSFGDFLSNTETSFNWLISDRLDMLHVLEGSTPALSQLDVIAMRSWVNDPEGPLKSSEQAVRVLGGFGFELIARGPERHPALETLLFAKDYPKVLETLTSDLEAANQQLADIKDGLDTEASKKSKLAQNNLAALEQRYADLLDKHKRTEKLVADTLTRLKRAESALDSDQ